MQSPICAISCGVRFLKIFTFFRNSVYVAALVLATPDLMFWYVTRSMAHSTTSPPSLAVHVAARGLLYMSASSPNSVPTPPEPTLLPPTMKSTWPSSTT